MADGTLIGNAYVNIVPEMDGFTKKLNDGISDANTTSSGKKLGDSLGKSAGGSFGKSFGESLDKAGSAISKAGKTLADAGSSLTSHVTLPIVGATAAVGAFALSTASAAETSEMAFTTMLGSAESARDMMEQLADFAARTPFELTGLVQSTQQLLAYGFAAEDVIPMLTKVGDAVAALGSGQQGIDAVTRALGQMQTKGTVSAEEMLQLTEQGIPAWQYLADAIGTDTAGAMDKVKDKAVSAADGIKAITDGMERDFGGMMEQQSKTVEGLMSNLQDSLTQPLMALRDTEAYEHFADALSDIVDEAEPFVESMLPHLEDGLDAVADVLEFAADAMESFADMSESSQKDIINLVGAVVAAGPAMTVLGHGIDFVGKRLQDASGLFGSVGSFFSKSLPDSITKVAGAFGDLGGPLSTFATTIAGAATPVTILATLVGGALVAAVAAFAAEAAEAAAQEELMRGATQSSSDIMAEAMGAASGYGDAIADIKTDADGTLESLRDLNEEVKDSFKDVYVDSSKLDQYVAVIDELANKSELSATQQYKLKEAVEGYNDIVGTQYQVVDAANGKIADQNGVVQENTDQLNANAQAWKNRAMSEALSNVSVKYMEAEADAAYQLQVAQENLADAYERRDHAADIINGRVEATAEEIAAASGEWDRLNRQIPEMEQNVSDLSAAYDTASQNAEDFSNMAAIQSAVFDTLGDRSTEFVTALSQSGVPMQQFADLSNEALTNVATNWDGTTSSILTSLADLGVQIPSQAYTAMLGLNTALSEGGAQAVTTAIQTSDVTAQQFADAVNQYGISGEDSIVAFANALASGNSVDVAAQIATDTADALSEADGTPAGQEIGEEFTQGVSDGGAGAAEAGSAVAQSAADAMSGVDTYTSGQHLSSNLAAGISSKVDEVVAAASSVMSQVASVMQFSVPKDGPFSGSERGGETSGKHLVQNFARGMEKAAPVLEDASVSLLSEVADTTEAVIEDTEEVAEATDEASQTVQRSIRKVSDAIKKEDIKKAVDDLTEAVDGNAGMKQAFENADLTVNGFAYDILSFGMTVDDVTGKLEDFASSVSDGFNRLSRFTSDVTLADYKDNLQHNIKEAQWYAEQVNDVFSKVADYAGADAFKKQVIEGGIDQWGRIIQELSGKTRDEIIQVIDLYNQAAQVGMDTGTQVLTSLIPGVVDAKTYESLGESVTDGMAQGIANGTGAVTDAAALMCSAVEGEIKDYFGIASPSKLMRRIFGYLGEGAALGISDKASSVVDAAGDMASMVASAYDVAYQPSDTKYYPAPDYSKSAGTQPINQTINFNQPMQTPSQVANTMRRYATYGLAGARR